jgi:hypothetical protein
MFVFDVETLGKESSAVILSMACVYFDARQEPSPEELRKSAFFAKFNVNDQVERLGRTMTRSSLSWWSKQCDIVKNKSFKPSDDDIIIDDGIEMMRDWSKQFPMNDKCWVWARGNLDQLVLDSVEEKLEIQPVFFFSRWRDVRTALDFMNGSVTGYVDVDYAGFNPAHHIMKHDPVDDCVYDAMQLMYGVNVE